MKTSSVLKLIIRALPAISGAFFSMIVPGGNGHTIAEILGAIVGLAIGYALSTYLGKQFYSNPNKVRVSFRANLGGVLPEEWEAIWKKNPVYGGPVKVNTMAFLEHPPVVGTTYTWDAEGLDHWQFKVVSVSVTIGEPGYGVTCEPIVPGDFRFAGVSGLLDCLKRLELKSIRSFPSAAQIQEALAKSG